MIILALLITLVFPSIINFIKSSNEKKDNITRNLVYNAAEMFIEDNSNKYYSNYGSKYCISIDTLIENNYLNSDLEYKGETLDDAKSVKVIYTTQFNYEITDIDDCTVCKLISDSDGSNSITPGDKYQCKVKDDMEQGFEEGYYFYVLSNNNEEMTNLIMDRNMYYDQTNDIGLVATESNRGIIEWMSEEDYGCGVSGDNCSKNDKGPVTAMKYLYNVTKDWTNISNIMITYEDENIDFNTLEKGTKGYGGIITKNNTMIITKKDKTQTLQIKNLKARFPSYEEIHGTGKCLTYAENDNQNGSCPLWLVNYLNFSDYYASADGKVSIAMLNGYWLLSSLLNYENNVWFVDKEGILNKLNAYDKNNSGVRPVITISNSLILN